MEKKMDHALTVYANITSGQPKTRQRRAQYVVHAYPEGDAPIRENFNVDKIVKGLNGQGYRFSGMTVDQTDKASLVFTRRKLFWNPESTRLWKLEVAGDVSLSVFERHLKRSIAKVPA